MTWNLRIALSRTFVHPIPGQGAFASISGGPPDLLAWLESQLGLHVLTNSCDRIAALLAAMERAIVKASPEPAIAKSFASHPMAVVARLLGHRDAFLIEVPLTSNGDTPAAYDVDAGNPRAMSPHTPPVITAVAMAAAAATSEELVTIMSGEADRLAAVMRAIVAGQKLPTCRLVIENDRSEWPARWRSLLDEVGRRNPHCLVEWKPNLPVARAASGCSLHAVQSALHPHHAAATTPPVVADTTLRAVRSASAAVAAHATACALKELSAEELSQTVLVCADDFTAAMIDGLLHAFDRPTMGIATSAQTSEILAVLPLAIAAVGIPADPGHVKELLALKASPFPNRLRKWLLKAMDDMPAVGSPRWNRVLRKVAVKWENGGRWAGLVDAWIPRPTRWRPGRHVFEVDAVLAAVKRVARWANHRRRKIDRAMQEALAAGETSPAEHAIRAQRQTSKAHYQCLRSRCKSMLALLQARPPGAECDHVDLMQLIDTATAGAIPRAMHPEMAGAPRRVRSFADVGEVLGHVENAIWVGPSRPPMPASTWAHRDVAAMHADGGVDLDSRLASLTALTRAERYGLCHLAGRLLVVCHPPLDSASRPHPLWALIAEMLWAGTTEPKPYSYEPELLDPSQATPPVAPWVVKRHSLPIEREPVGSQSIKLPPKARLGPRKTVSHSDTELRLSCPLAWAIRYGASIDKPVDAALANPWITRGNVAERVLNEVFAPTAPSNLADAQRQLRRIWTRRLPRLDAGLCLPEERPQSDAFFEILRDALPVLQTLLNAGATLSFGQRVDRLVAVGGGRLRWLGKKPTGAIDVIGTVPTLGGKVPIVIDMKYGSRKKRVTALKAGLCSQLVLYSLFVGRSKPGTAVDAIGYFIITEGRLIVPEWASGVLNNPPFFDPPVEIIKKTVTLTLSQAITDLDARVSATCRLMHAKGATLDAHPRIAVSSGIVDPDLASVYGSDATAAEEAACEFCPYGILCGRERIV